MFERGASTQKMVCLFEKMKENEGEEVDAAIAIPAYLWSTALSISASRSDWSRSAEMEDDFEEEDEGVREGD